MSHVFHISAFIVNVTSLIFDNITLNINIFYFHTWKDIWVFAMFEGKFEKMFLRRLSSQSTVPLYWYICDFASLATFSGHNTSNSKMPYCEWTNDYKRRNTLKQNKKWSRKKIVSRSSARRLEPYRLKLGNNLFKTSKIFDTKKKLSLNEHVKAICSRAYLDLRAKRNAFFWDPIERWIFILPHCCQNEILWLLLNWGQSCCENCLK